MNQIPSKIENSKYSDAKIYGTDLHVVLFVCFGLLW